MGRTTFLRQINLLVDKPYQKRAVKCYLAFWPEDDVNHLRFMYTTRYAERKPGLDKSQVWLTLHNFILSIDLYVQKKV